MTLEICHKNRRSVDSDFVLLSNNTHRKESKKLREMYARVSYTCTKQVNAKLWNPGYSLNKVPSEDHVALLVDEPTTTKTKSNTSRRTSKSTEPRKSVDSDVFEDSGISDGLLI